MNIPFISKNKKLQIMRRAIIALSGLLVVAIAYVAFSYAQSGTDNTGQLVENTSAPIKVSTSVIGEYNAHSSTITATGVVKPATKIDVVGLTRGTVRSLNIEIGNTVVAGEQLVLLSESGIATNYQNAQTSYQNAQNGLQVTEQLSQETIRQAELSIENAKKSLESATISFATARNNYDNTKEILEKQALDTKNSALISYAGYANTIDSTLDQINFLIKAEGDRQVAGIANTLSVLNTQALTTAKNAYFGAKNAGSSLATTPTSSTVVTAMHSVVLALDKTKIAVDAAVATLDNTVPTSEFNDTSLNAQKSVFWGLRTSVVTAQTNAKSSLQVLENIDLNNKKQLDALQNAIIASENQVRLAEISVSNANAALASTNSSRSQQLLTAKSSVDNARGQLNVVGSQVADLRITAPIRGTITGKFIELGSEVSVGQKIAEISQTDSVKVEVAIPSEDVYRIEIGQIVVIQDALEGVISRINPSADPLSRKVTIEILYDNKNRDLVPETFVRVSIAAKVSTLTSADSFLIPLSAITASQTENYVFVAIGGKARKRVLVLGAPQGSVIEVTSGLVAGDVLIVGNNKRLKDGDSVEVVE